MARLNEPPIAPAAAAAALVNGFGAAGTESVEVLKRRFIRQNRELAKNNSAQSLRIRSLELEVSKLLGDNLDLREQVLRLQDELYDARMQASNAAARRVKADLRAKLAELSGLIDGIDDEEAVDTREVPDKARLLSPSRQQYRERQPLAELMQETQMPTIAEDQMYPRRTSDEIEIRQTRWSDGSAATGSPDLGPPPVAHFDDLPKLGQEEPVEEGGDQSNGDGEEELLPTINLETRRKRKDPSLPRESRRSSILAHSPDKPDDAPSTMLRTGAKRKLADRDAEKPVKPPAQGDFTFSRRASAVQSAPAEHAERESVEIKAPAEEILRPVSPLKPARRVLGNKSTNTSPVKTTRKAAEDPFQDDLKKPAPPKLAARPPSRGSRRASSVNSIPTPPVQNDLVSVVDILPPRPSSADVVPKTPAAEDIFSPAASEPSVQQHTACDTPPPSDLSTISNTTEGGQRPSRRARSAVNYAEPSLVAKMRRPDKKMADAISGLQDHRRVMSVTSTTSKRTGSGIVKIKEEHSDEPAAWGGLPHTSSLSRESMGSPLRHLTTDDGTHLSPRPSPRASPSRPSSRLLLSDSGDNTEGASRSSTSGSISTLLANSRKRREALDKRISPPSSAGSSEAVDAAARRLEELDLYEFKESSSPAGVEEARGSRVSHRRHSSVLKVAPAEPERSGRGVASGDPAVPELSSTRVSSRRRSMML